MEKLNGSLAHDHQLFPLRLSAFEMNLVHLTASFMRLPHNEDLVYRYSNNQSQSVWNYERLMNSDTIRTVQLSHEY